MPSEILNIYKPQGVTPLVALERLRKVRPDLQDEVMTYAGRLDPLAEGVLLVLAGDSRMDLQDHLKLDKEYEGSILFGVTTDTYDVLGIPQDIIDDMREDEVRESILGMKGRISLPFPPFSSYKVNGKPLLQWTLEGRLSEIEIPVKEREVYDIEVLKVSDMESRDLLGLIMDSVSKVEGTFRQDEISEAWRRSLSESDRVWKVADIRVSCSSGTYIRSLANELGGCLLRLKRTKVGDHSCEDSVRL